METQETRVTVFSADKLGMVGQLKYKEKTKDLSTWLSWQFLMIQLLHSMEMEPSDSNYAFISHQIQQKLNEITVYGHK